MFTQSFDELSIKTNGSKLIKITEKIVNFVDRSMERSTKFTIFSVILINLLPFVLILNSSKD